MPAFNGSASGPSPTELLFLQSLSPEQRAMFLNLKVQSEGANATPDPEPQLPAATPATARIFEGTGWYGISPGRASDVEVRALGMLLSACHSRGVVDKFLSKAEPELPRMAKLGDEWAPVADSTVFHHSGLVLGPLEKALHNKVEAAGGDGTIETVVAALASTEGGNITITPSSVYAYCQALLKTPRRLRLKGPPRDGGRSHSARHISALPMLLELLRHERRQLRYAVDRHRVVVMTEVNMTHAELADRLVEMEVEHEEATSNLTAQFDEEREEMRTALKEKQGNVDTANKRKSKAQRMSTKKDLTKSEVRKEEKAKAKEAANKEVAAIRERAAEEADEALVADVKRKKEIATAAHKLKREALAAKEKADELAACRLKENKMLKRKVEELQGDVEELKEAANDKATDATTVAMKLAYDRVTSMPTWGLVRLKGRGGSQLELIYRETIYKLFSLGNPLSSIGPTITTIVKATAPWLCPREVTARTLNDCRFEMRTLLETLSALEVATAYAIRMLGFDETTKFGNASITSNVIIEPTQGGKLKAVVLRGAYCSGGGTSEAIAKAIESKCFGRLRDLLRRLKATFLKLYPGKPWPGPEPEQLSMARLAGGGALMSDTCNGAEKAKTILAEMVANQMREKMGPEAWGKLSEEEQVFATRVHKLDCWQHMRNIFLREMSSTQSKLVAEELKPQLDTFSSWERMTTDFDQLLRASEKEFHHHCRCA